MGRTESNNDDGRRRVLNRGRNEMVSSAPNDVLFDQVKARLNAFDFGPLATAQIVAARPG